MSSSSVARDLLPSLSKSAMIRDVWAENLEAEFKVLRELVRTYNFVAMDTEFPGVVAKPVGTFKTPYEFYYQTLRTNVNLLKIIQVGFTLLNDKGEVPDKCCTWQFNFKFSLQDDMYAQDSIDLLAGGGISFEYSRTHGIEMAHFAELLTTSGLILSPEVHWLSFHSGYDFGYLLKTVSGVELSDKEEEFTQLLKLYFPSVFDIKCMLRLTDITHTMGLDAVADVLGVRRIGTAHQAGSDSLLTGHCFFRLVKERFEGRVPISTRNLLYGLAEDANSSQSQSQSATVATPISASSSAAPTGSSPASYTGNPAGAFPATPLMTMVMHGGKSGGPVHSSGVAGAASGGGK